MSDNNTLFTLDAVRICYHGTAALDGVSWSLAAGCHHAVLGMNGSGKSTLLRLIGAELRPDQSGGGSIHWNIDGQREDSPIAVKGRYGFVSAELQEKYIRQAWRMTGEEIILSGFFASPMLYSKPTESQREAALETARLLDATHLLDMELPAMSQGQLRKVLLVRAVVHKPQVLLLDEICEGLDAATRDSMLSAIDSVAGPHTTVLLTGHRPDEFPACITRGIVLHNGKIAMQGSLDAALEALRNLPAQTIKEVPAEHPAYNCASVQPHGRTGHENHTPLCESSACPAHNYPDNSKSEQNKPDQPNLGLANIGLANISLANSEQASSEQTNSDQANQEQATHEGRQHSPAPDRQHIRQHNSAAADCNTIINITDAQVFIERKQILHDITWRIRSGENWLVTGPNGAGKSTLLRLIYGDERQAWGGKVQWFGSSEPVALQEVHRKIAIVSDKLQATYGHDKYHSTLMELSGEDLVLSGFFSSTGLWWNTVTDAQKYAAAQWMHRLGITSQAHKPVRNMSYGTLRRFMLARALVANPQLIILDEPLSGLDERSRAQFLKLLSSLALQGVQLILVTHHQSDIIPEITHELHLSEGRITYCGPAKQTRHTR